MDVCAEREAGGNHMRTQEACRSGNQHAPLVEACAKGGAQRRVPISID
jgi:hypothetical protein